MCQVAKDNQLLDTARDCFYFVTKYFEPINASATHIYHSALELCPTSSIVRKLYYHRCHRVTRLPRVITGTPDSWDQTLSISGKGYEYEFCAWSPCGRFVAARTEEVVEIRNQLTFELLTTLRPTKNAIRLVCPISYSPDGRSIVCASTTGVVIWDIQTGGVAKEIQHDTTTISLAWSLDGRTIGTIDNRDVLTVHIHDIASGTTLSLGDLESRDKPYLWAYEASFRVMTTSLHTSLDMVEVKLFDVGSTLLNIHSFRIKTAEVHIGDQCVNKPTVASFSPITCRVSVSFDYALRVFEDKSSNTLLEERGLFFSHCFSSDGSLFAASKENGIRLWKYTSGLYLVWKEFQCQDWTESPLRFSPTSSSILGHSRNILQVWRLHDLPIVSQARRHQYIGLSRSGNRIAAAQKLERTITTTDLHSRTPSQFIDTGVAVEGLVITGNVLLVMGSEKVVAWLLTDDGVVDGVFGNKPISESDGLWTLSLPRWSPDLWKFSVEGRVGTIKSNGNSLFTYDTETGDILQPSHAPQPSGNYWYHLGEVLCGRHYLHYHNLSQCNVPPEESWQTSRATLREGWVKDPEGRCRLWIPVEWRMSWDDADWRHDVTTQFSILRGKPVIIKF